MFDWRALRLATGRRDKWRCQYCYVFAPRGECDHVRPRSRGGPDALYNLAWSCGPCNRSKGARLFAPDLKRQLALCSWGNLPAWLVWRVERLLWGVPHRIIQAAIPGYTVD